LIAICHLDGGNGDNGDNGDGDYKDDGCGDCD